MVSVGDTVRERVNTEGGSLQPPAEGRVVYVHPLGRFFTAEFAFPDPWGGTRKIREAYILPRESGDDGMPPRRRQQGAVDQDSRPPRGQYLEAFGVRRRTTD